MFNRSWNSQNFFEKPTRVTNCFLDIIPNSEITINGNFYIDFKNYPSKDSLIAIQFNLDEFLIASTPLLDFSDTVLIYSLNENLKRFETSSTEFWEIKNRISSDNFFIIDASILLLSINNKFEEQIEAIVPIKLKFES
jgi:hypothetical protein